MLKIKLKGFNGYLSGSNQGGVHNVNTEDDVTVKLPISAKVIFANATCKSNKIGPSGINGVSLYTFPVDNTSIKITADVDTGYETGREIAVWWFTVCKKS